MQNFTAAGDGTHTGNITLRGDFEEVLTIGNSGSEQTVMQGDISIEGLFQVDGTGSAVIRVYGDMEGEFDFDASFYGRLFIHGNLLNSITIDGVLGRRDWSSHHALIEIDGNFGKLGTATYFAEGRWRLSPPARRFGSVRRRAERLGGRAGRVARPCRPCLWRLRQVAGVGPAHRKGERHDDPTALLPTWPPSRHQTVGNAGTIPAVADRMSRPAGRPDAG